MNYQWNWGVFLHEAPEGGVRYWELLAEGLGWTLAVSAIAWAIALAAGLVVGTLRTVPGRTLPVLAAAWVELFRNIPLLVQMFLWYFVLPELLPPLKRLLADADPTHGQFAAAVICLGLFTSARIAEQVRAGIRSLPRGQGEAAAALGMSTLQAYRHVLLPMALRIIVPPLTSEAMNLIKNSSVALTIGLAELTFRARELGEYTFNFFEAFTAATLIYVVIAMSANRAMAWIERHVAVPGYIAGGRQ